jgi:Glycoside hydrolase family 44
VDRMQFNNDANRGSWPGGSPAPTVPYNNRQMVPVQGWKGFPTQGTPPPRRPKGRGRRLLSLLSIVLLVVLIIAAVRMTSVASGSSDQLVLKVGDQQQALIDLRQSMPISPYLYGVNVFPESGTVSIDNTYSGFMDYGPTIVNGMKSAGIKLLRFPGGNWGEDQEGQNHILSYEQLDHFSTLLKEVGADGMVQARLSSPIDISGKPASLPARVTLAAKWVNFMSYPNSYLRTGIYRNEQIHPIKFWSVGNEPDRLVNPDTGKTFTVAEYINAFIQYSIAMHKQNPTIKVFGPEISQFFGVGIGPSDSENQLWMEGFLQGVAAYEKAHQNELNKLGFHLLDGVSLHRYQFNDASSSPYLLMSSPQEWNYLLPSLRQFIRQTFGRDVPVAVTEINTNPNAQSPTRGRAALWWADTLGTLMNQQADYVAYFSAEGVDQPYPLFTSDASHKPTSMFWVMQLFARLQHNLVPLQIQRDPMSVYATQDDAHQAVSLLFINKSGENQYAEVSAQNQLFGISPWHSQGISIAAYSMVLITLHRGSGAEAYSFTVPTTVDQDPSGNPVILTTCGNKIDPLNYDIPC